jgi:hypothetical protein
MQICLSFLFRTPTFHVGRTKFAANAITRQKQRGINVATTSRRLMKKAHGKAGSQTPGKKKGETCQADWRKKFYLTSCKAHKDSGYTSYHEWALAINGQKPSK